MQPTRTLARASDPCANLTFFGVRDADLLESDGDRLAFRDNVPSDPRWFMTHLLSSGLLEFSGPSHGPLQLSDPHKLDFSLGR